MSKTRLASAVTGLVCQTSPEGVAWNSFRFPGNENEAALGVGGVTVGHRAAGEASRRGLLPFAGHRAFGNRLVLLLGHARENGEDHLAHGGSGVYGFGDGAEDHAVSLPQGGRGGDGVGKVSGEAVELPDQEDRERAFAGQGQDAGEAGPGLGSRGSRDDAAGQVSLIRRSFKPTLLLAAGENMKTIQEFLGHSRFSTTADTYAHTLPDQHRQVAETMDRILDPRG